MIRKRLIRILKNEPVVGLRTYYGKQHSKKLIIKESFTTNSFVVILVKSGTFQIKLQEEGYKLYPQEVLIISQNQRCSQIIISEKGHIFFMGCSAAFLFQNNFEIFCLLSSGAAKATGYGKEFGEMVQLLKLVCILNKNKNPARKTELLYLIEILFLKLTSVDAVYISASKAKTVRKEYLILQFHLLLKDHFKSRHNVGFYADKLCITPGYLNRVVKQATGYNAKIVIEQKMVMEIKKQLQNKELTLLEIAEQLGFNDLPSFSTFFKTHTSVAPSEYRSQMRNRF